MLVSGIKFRQICRKILLYEWRSWLREASAHGCLRCPWVAPVDARSVHKRPSWVLEASMSGTHGCWKCPWATLMDARSAREWPACMPPASMIGWSGCLKCTWVAVPDAGAWMPKASMSRAHGCSKCTWAAPMDAPSFHEWHSRLPDGAPVNIGKVMVVIQVIVQELMLTKHIGNNNSNSSNNIAAARTVDRETPHRSMRQMQHLQISCRIF